MSDEAIDLAELRSSIRDVLVAEASAERVRKHVESGAAFDQGLARTAKELGWAALGVGEAHGGLGLGFSALAGLYEELGRGPAALPLLPTMLAAEALGSAPRELQARWLPALAAGEAFAACAAAPHLAGDRWTGRVDHVADGAGADLFLLRAADGRSAFIARDAAGVTVEPVAAMDRTRSFAALVLDNARPAHMAVNADALDRHEALGLACDSIGGAEAILEKTIEYLKTRTQFGQPIGKFQALKHRVATHKLRLESARAAVARALCEQGTGARSLGLALLAKTEAAGAYVAIADDAVQLHGGIGFTFEHECHVYLKRARLNQALLGGEAAALDRAASLLSEAA